MQKHILVIIYDTFSEFELSVATSVLARKYKLIYASPEGVAVKSEGNITCIPDRDFSNLSESDYQGVLIPGGLDMKPLAERPELSRLLQETVRAGKPVAAICGAPMALAQAGVLEGRRFTASFTAEQRAFLGFPTDGYVEEDLVQDGTVLTATGNAYAQFGLAVGRLFDVFADDEQARRLDAYYLWGRA